MNISSEILHIDGSNSSSDLFHNGTEVDDDFSVIPVLYLVSTLLGFPINSYMIWLMVTGTGNGLAAELFSLSLAVVELFICVQSVFILMSYQFETIWKVVCFLDGLAFTGRPLFQCLICVERYLAVVHPVTFIRFKPLRYRVICSVISCVASLVSGGVNIILYVFQSMLSYFVFLFAQFLLFLSIQLLCCLAVLRALKQSGPGERGREKNEENHMKRRAFNFIVITTMITVFLNVPFIILLVLFSSAPQAGTVFFIISICFTLTGLVQPLLFLYRVRKLACIKY